MRSAAKQQAIVKQYADRAAQLDFAIVEDISASQAFDAAVVADPPLDYVVHTASPFHLNVQDPEKDFLKPAVEGTRGLLQSVKAHAPSVKRVVITSRCAVSLPPHGLLKLRVYSVASIINLAKGQWPGTTFTDAGTAACRPRLTYR